MVILSKKILISIAAVTILGAGALGIAGASAASDPSGSGGSLVQRIANTFHLDQSKVQAVVNQYKSDKQAQAESNYENKLTQAVTAGTLTPGQKTLILAEHQKLQTELATAQGQTGSARMTAIQQVRTEASDWAKANNINAKWLLGPRPLRGMGPRGNWGQNPSPSPSPTPDTSASN